MSEARQRYQSLDRYGKLIADLRAISDAPGPTATIVSAAADELEMMHRALKDILKDQGTSTLTAKIARDALGVPCP